MEMKTAKKTKKKAEKIDWKARAEKAERVVAAAAQFEYQYFMCYQTYTNRQAAESAQKMKDAAFEDLRWMLRDTGTLKRD
jgi:hypothetical protein